MHMLYIQNRKHFP